MVGSLGKPSEGQYFLVGDCVGVDTGRINNMEGSKYIYIYIYLTGLHAPPSILIFGWWSSKLRA